MSTISNYDSISNNWYLQNSSYASALRRSKNAGIMMQTGFEKADVSGSSKASETLDSLVTSGTITEDQETAIKEAMQAAIQSSSYSRDRIQSGSSDSTSAVKKVDPLDSLVAAGTITADQQTAIKEAFEAERKSGKMQPPPPPSSEDSNNTNPMETTLDGLVEAGTITEDQKTSILNAFEAAFKSDSNQSETSAYTNSDYTSLADYLDDSTDSANQTASAADIFQSAMAAYQTQLDAAGDNLYTDNLEI